VSGRVRDETRSSAVIPATEFSLTHGEYRIGSGSACRAKPVRGAASGMSPQPGAAPLPCGSAPLKLTGTARAPGAANVISPSEGVYAVSAQQCCFGRGVASGPQVSVAVRLPAVLRRRATRGTRYGGHPIPRPHLTETTARPRASHPRHQTRYEKWTAAHRPSRSWGLGP
jgi:hypothetical protein